MIDPAEAFARSELEKIGRRLTKFSRDDYGDWILESVRDRWPLQKAKLEADRLLGLLEHHTERIAIAGSIRRERTTVKDIEIVCVTKYVPVSKDLFGKVSRFVDLIEERVEELVRSGVLVFRDVNGRKLNGPKYKALELCDSSIAVDLFIVRAPATWGVIYLLRTGSGDFNKRLLKVVERRGMKMSDGRLLRNGIAIETPEELDVFRVLRAKYVEPRERN